MTNQSCTGTYVVNDSLTTSPHMRQDGTNRPDVAEVVHFKLTSCVGKGLILEGSEIEDCGIVGEYVYLALLVGDFVDRCSDIVIRRHIALEVPHLTGMRLLK